MRPIFTIHAGEYLVGTKIEETFPDLQVWVPSIDTGIDLLITDDQQDRVASLQVKFSKDYVATKKSSALAPAIVSGGWWTLNRAKLAKSTADYWILVLYRFQARQFDFVVIPPRKLLERYNRLGARKAVIQSYFGVTDKGRCWETRGLNKSELSMVSDGTYSNRDRDFTPFLNVWPFAEHRT